MSLSSSLLIKYAIRVRVSCDALILKDTEALNVILIDVIVQSTLALFLLLSRIASLSTRLCLSSLICHVLYSQIFVEVQGEKAKI